jgi:orotate phosphoribosyltransferase
MTPRKIPRLPPQLREQLLAIVLERGYTRSAEPFQLSSGGLSHDYVDLRRALSRGEDLRLAADAVIAALDSESIGYTAIGGMTMGADPIAHAVAVVRPAEWFSVRKAEKDHGSKRRVEGVDLSPLTPVVAFEDTVSTGRSLLDAIDVIASTGAPIVAACTLLDRGEAAAEELSARSIPYLALLTYHDLGIVAIGGTDALGAEPDAGRRT